LYLHRHWWLCFWQSIFKGPKLSIISPNKTYAGVIGGFFFSVLFLYLILSFVSFFDNYNLVFNLKTIIYIIFLSLISQIGDLIISYFKRLSKIKDTGSLIPGHGGILDRIDGMIFVFPFALILNLYL
jgi:phosphatidate cytidylyltransferase